MCGVVVVYFLNFFVLCLATKHHFRSCFEDSHHKLQHDDHFQAKDILSIREPTWLFRTGVQRAEYQDRQDLGIVLRAGGVLKVRQVNANFQKNIVVLLLPFKDESYGKFLETPTIEAGNMSWSEISTSVDAVPFADTPYGSTIARLEFRAYCSHIAPLHTLTPDDDEAQFFQKWTASNSSFAIAKNDYIQLLIPIDLLPHARTLRENSRVFDSLIDMLEFFKNLITFLDSIIGLDGSSSIHKVPQNRHFLSTAKSNWFYDSFQLRHLDDWFQNPTIDLLGEFSGGYYYLTHQNNSHGDDSYTQRTYSSNFYETYYHSGNILRKFYNILFEYHYFDTIQDADVNDTFSSKKFLEATEELLYKDYISENNVFGSLTSYNAEVIFLLTLIQAAGINALTAMHKDYRAAVNQDFAGDIIGGTILLSEYCSKNALIDFMPFFERWGYSVNSNKWSNFPAAAMLVDVVPTAALGAARGLLARRTMISSNFQLALNEEIAPLDLRGDLTLYFDTELNLKGVQALIKDGTRVVTEKIIQKDKTITFKNILNGIYTLELRGDAVQKYVVRPQYVYVKELKAPVTVEFKKVNAAVVLNPLIQFYGVHNKSFATVAIYYKETPILVFKSSDYIANFMNSAGGYDVYATVQVTDSQGTTKYEKVIKEQTASAKEVAQLNEGDIIKIFHRETATKLRSKNVVIDTSSNINMWQMTRFGLKNLALNNDPLIVLDFWANDIIRDPFLRNLPFYLSTEKKQLLAAIHSLPELHKKHYLGKYGNMLPQTSNTITLTMTGEDTNVLEGLTVQLENSRFMQQQQIQNGEVTFQNLPLDTYLVKIPNDELLYLDIDPNVIVVNETEYRTEIRLGKIRTVQLDDAFLKYLASRNSTIRKLIIAVNPDGLITITVKEASFLDLDGIQVYVLVRDRKGLEKFNKAVGVKRVVDGDMTTVGTGDELEVYRSDSFDQLTQTSVWRVTTHGLQRIVDARLPQRIDETARKLQEDITYLNTAILSLLEPNRTTYRKKYIDLMSCSANLVQ